MSTKLTREQYRAILKAHATFQDALRGRQHEAQTVPAMHAHGHLIKLMHDAGIPTDGWVAR